MLYIMISEKETAENEKPAPEKEAKKKKVKVKSTDLPVQGQVFMELKEKSVLEMFEQEVHNCHFHTAAIEPAKWLMLKPSVLRLVRFPGRSNQIQCRQRLATAELFVRSCVAQALCREDWPRHSSHASA